MPIPGAFSGRVAPDEVMLIGAEHVRSLIVDAASDQLAQMDPHGLTVDQTSAWSVWTLSGPHAAEAFARLSAASLPTESAFVQAAIAGVPGKAVVLPDRIHVLVSSSLGHHLRERVLGACKDMPASEGAPRPLDVERSATSVEAASPGGAHSS